MRETFFSCENEHTHTQTFHQLGNMKFYLKKKVLSQMQELPFSFYLSPPTIMSKLTLLECQQCHLIGIIWNMNIKCWT